MVILDTNIIIDHLRREGKTSSYLESLIKSTENPETGISVITIQELFAGKSTRDLGKHNFMLHTITPHKMYPYTYEVAQLAGKISREHISIIDFADAAIAATAIVHGGQLFTLNTKDFKGIIDLRLYSLNSGK